MPRVKIVQITIPATPREITLLHKAATHSGLPTPAGFVAALFEGTPLTDRSREAYAEHPPIPKRSARPNCKIVY
jgi:hypothetical protein